MIDFFAFLYDSFKWIILIFIIVGIWFYWLFSGDKTALYIILFVPPIIGLIMIIREFRK